MGLLQAAYMRVSVLYEYRFCFGGVWCYREAVVGWERWRKDGGKMECGLEF